MPAVLNAATWRTHPQFPIGHVYIHRPTTVFSCRVSQANFNYPLLGFLYSSGVGTVGDIQPGMTMLVGTAAGLDDRGRQRIRKACDASYLYPGWSSRGRRDGELDLAQNLYVTVLNDYRVWAKIPRYTGDGTMYKDGDIAIGTYGTQQPPVANDGPAIWGKADPATNKYRTTWNAGGSVPMASGAIISSYNRPCKDGTFVVGSASTSVATIDFPAGFRYIDLTVTDSNGQTHTCHTPVYVEPATSTGNSVLKVQVVQPRRSTPDGSTIVLKIWEDLSTTVAPEGSLVIYAEDEYYGGTKGSVNAGFSGRENTKFVGWIQREDWSVEGSEFGLVRVTTLTCVDVAERLRTLPGFPQTVARSATAGSWNYMANANGLRYLHYLLYWHSTALEVADWIPVTDDYPFIIHGSEGKSLWAQVQQRAEAQGCVLTCDRQGRMFVKRDQQLRNAADRTSTVIVALTDADYLNLHGVRTRPPRYHWLRGSAIQTATTDIADIENLTTYFVIAPGTAPGQGVSPTSHGEQLVKTAQELQEREGNRYSARLNAMDGAFELDLMHPGDAGFDPAWMEWIQLTLASSHAAQRGFYYTAERFLIQELTEVYTYPPAGPPYKQAHLKIEREVTEQIPAPVDPVYGSQVIVPYTPPVIGQVLPNYSSWGAMATYVVPTCFLVMDKTGHVAYWNGTTWTDRSPDSTQLSRVWEAFKLARDPFNYKRYLIYYRNNTAANESVLICDDITATFVTWTNTSIFESGYYGYTGADFKGSINKQGYFFWTLNDASGNVYVGYTLDNFAHVGHVDAYDITFPSFGNPNHYPTLALGNFNPQSGASVNYLVGYASILKSTDWFSTDMGAGNVFRVAPWAQCCGGVVPYSLPSGGDNKTQTNLLFGQGFAATHMFGWAVYDTIGTYLAFQMPTVADEMPQSSDAMIANEIDGNYLAGVVAPLAGGVPKLIVSDDGGYTFLPRTLVRASVQGDQAIYHGAISGFPKNKDFLLVCGYYWLQFSSDRGLSWTGLHDSLLAWQSTIYGGYAYPNYVTALVDLNAYYSATVNPIL